MLTRVQKWSWLKAWAMNIAKRRGQKKAIVALARRLAVIMHRMWSDGTEFPLDKGNGADNLSDERQTVGATKPQSRATMSLAGRWIDDFTLNSLSARQSGLRGFISPWGKIADIPAGCAGGSQSLVGNCPYFGPCGAGFGRRSLVAIFQFPFRRGGDRFDCRQRPVRRGPLGSQADAGTKSTASVDSLADIRCVS